MRRRMLVLAVVAVWACALLGGAARAQQPPGPTVVYRTAMEVTSPPSAFDIINVVLDFAPGARTPLHVHGGQGFMTVLEGELVYQPQGGAEQRTRAGETFLDVPERPHIARNDTQAPARGVFTVVLPKGATLTTVAEPAAPAPAPAAPASPALPATGGPLSQPVALPNTGTERWHLPVLLAATVLLLSGLAARRQGRRDAR